MRLQRYENKDADYDSKRIDPTKHYSLEYVKDGKKGCVLVDIDDCILKADGSQISIIKRKPGESEKRLSSEEYAKDPDAGKPENKKWFSYEEFRDPVKVFNSIVNGTPQLKQLRLVDQHVRAQWDIAFLTARGLQDVVDKALREFLKFRDKDGKLQPIGDNLKSGISAAGVYPGATDPEKKANVIKKICAKYDYVKFVDDDLKNVQFAKSLGLKNLQVIHARPN